MRSVIRYSNRSDGVLDRNNLPWLLTEQQRNDVKEVIQRIKFPTGFASNINNILTKKGEFGGVKTHDWLSLPNEFENGVKQFIYDLVKYMR